MTFTPDEEAQRLAVREAVLEAVRADSRILLPPFDPVTSVASVLAPVSAGLEPNPYGGTVGPYRYQFEGEDDLLHLMVVRQDQGVLTPEEGQTVLEWLLPELPPALVWLKPGERSQHFYFGHDELLRG